MAKVKMIITKTIEEVETTINVEEIKKIEENLYKLCIDEDTGGMFGILKKPVPEMGLDKYDIIEIFGLLPEVKEKWEGIYYSLSNLSEDAKEKAEYQELYEWVKGLPTVS